jgi:trk system potassium uptake protein TrkA
MVGAGLARRLMAGKHDVVVVERDREVCERVYSQLGVTTINGSATSINILEDAELSRADVAVAAMRNDADNLTFALLSKNMGVERILARMRDPRYEDAYKLAGVTRVFNIVELYVNQFTWEIEDPEMREVTSFGEGDASMVFVKVSDRSRAAGHTVAEIDQSDDFPVDCVIAAIFRPDTGEFILPRGNATVEVGDRVYLAAHNDTIRKAARYLGGR